MSWKPLKRLEKFVRKEIGYENLAIAAALAGAGYLAYSTYAGAGTAATAGSMAGTAGTTAGTTAATTAASTGWTTGNTLAAVSAGMQGVNSYQQAEASKKAQAEYEKQQEEAQKLAMAQRKDSLTRLRKGYDTANYSVSSPQNQQGQGRIVLG